MANGEWRMLWAAVIHSVSDSVSVSVSIKQQRRMENGE
jgi:hypothetical protein